MPTVTDFDKAFAKLAKATEGFYRTTSANFVDVYKHREDERHLVVDTRTCKIVKRFRDAETSWSDAERFADDYYWAHRNEERGL